AELRLTEKPAFSPVAIQTQEDYRVAILSEGNRYKALGHSVAEDETLYVNFRSQLSPRKFFCGDLQMTSAGLVPVADTMAPQLSEVRSLHYHPSGRVNLKDSKGTNLKSFRSIPLQMLRE